MAALPTPQARQKPTTLRHAGKTRERPSPAPLLRTPGIPAGAPGRRFDRRPAARRRGTRTTGAVSANKLAPSSPVRLSQLDSQRFSRPRQSRLHRTDSNPQRKPDFVVAQTVNLPKNHHGALVERQPTERLPYARRQFLLPEDAIRFGQFAGGRQVAVGLEPFVERHLLSPVATPPPPLAVMRLVDDNAINPGPKGGLAAETADRAEDVEKDFLGQVQGFVVVTQQVETEVKDHSLVLGYQLRTGRLIARRAPADQRRFAAPDLGPADG